MSIKEKLEQELLRHLPLSDPIVVRPETPLQEAIERMRRGGVGVVVVCQGSYLKGIFTERDFLVRVVGDEVDRARPIAEFMITSPHTLMTSSTVMDAIHLMAEHRVRRIPVLNEGGQVVKVANADHIVHYLAELFPGEVLNLPPRLRQVMQTPEGG